jgi:cation:H+ antiporter
MLSTLVIPILAVLLIVFARAGARSGVFHLNYRDVMVDLSFFSVAYGVALVCVLVPSRVIHGFVAAGLIGWYLFYIKLKFTADGEETPVGGIEPLMFARATATPSYTMIGLQAVVGLIGLILGAHLFVTAAESIAATLAVAPLILSLLIAPLATELPEMSNSFLWLYRKKDRLAVGNVTGAMVFQGTFPVSVGLLGTDWSLAPNALVTMVLAVVAAGALLLQASWGGKWRPWLLSASALLYIGYAIYLYGW